MAADEEARQDAQLKAAAPKLLAALIEIRDHTRAIDNILTEAIAWTDPDNLPLSAEDLQRMKPKPIKET